MVKFGDENRMYLILFNVRMQQRASIGEKFYENSRHSGDLKKMKKKLGETADFHMKYCSGDGHEHVY